MEEREIEDWRRMYVNLAWLILELKFQYYYPADVHPSWGSEYVLEDASYDQLEADYKELAKEHSLNTSASDHVGFPHDTPSGKLVMSRLMAPKPKEKKS